ncbi:DgyrCDS13920 [Dimorphilus gyrociliatus]|uniref:KAT8 regulatory NSL complex subunit 2 n=1 Tax=Dimorphilus gyrociliatus TaxID=2664684 RepID=A0A7I8WC28_9ANNE|nr:DgyrCDS13920 [Dimorphilus gyrociliatus]
MPKLHEDAVSRLCGVTEVVVKSCKMCYDHLKKTQAQRRKLKKKRGVKDTPDNLLGQLDKYAVKNPTSIDPIQESLAKKVLCEPNGSDESDLESMCVSNTWTGEDDSDNDSLDNEPAEPLNNAGVYTPEELATLMKEKLMRLQTLYIEQFRYLQYELKQKRRKYMLARKIEAETGYGSTRHAKYDPEQRYDYECMKAMKNFHKPSGIEALLHEAQKNKGIEKKIDDTELCVQTNCQEPVLPATKHCLQHILSDSEQVLFSKCLREDCGKPIISHCPDLVFCEDHILPPTLQSSNLPNENNQTKLDSSMLDVEQD